jgi:serine/threonine protein kinase
MIGKLLNEHYRIIKTLGVGGFGQTYLAEDLKAPGNPVCVVKQLKPLNALPEELAKAESLFEQEAQKLIQLSGHDQIPKLLDYFSDGNDWFLVQEYVEGLTLATELQPGQVWSEPQVIQFLLDLLPVLTYVHEAGIVHRDIKPPNVIRRVQDNKPVLIDFGAVKEVQLLMGQPVQSTVATGTVIGTKGYMPSEQGQGKPRPCSDLYALGMICIQALTGKMPSQLDDDLETGELVWQHLAQASLGLKQILEKMTRDYFVDRYQSAAEVLQALQGVDSSPTNIPTKNYAESVKDEVPAVTSTHKRNNKYLLLVIGGVALAAASAFFVINALLGQSKKTTTSKAITLPNKIMDSRSNFCLDISENKDAGAALFQPCSKSSGSSQSWVIQDGVIKHLRSGRCLDVASNRIGGPVVIHSCYPNPQSTFQSWSMNSRGILNLKSNLCLDASNDKSLVKAILNNCQIKGQKFQVLPIN